MNQSLHRGRLLYFALAALVILDQAAAIISALFGARGEFGPWQSFGSPCFAIVGMIFLWQGENWLRRLMAIWSAIHAATLATVLVKALYYLVDGSPA